MSSDGQNRGYIDELYERYRSDPQSVSEAWRDYFADYRPEAASPATRATSDPSSAEPLAGTALAIATNMTASLSVPTATSARTIPVKTLEENRRAINLHQGTVDGAKISFTQLIAWCVVRALAESRAMTARYAESGGRPGRVAGGAVHLGLAVDLERKGQRALVVPVIRDADRLDFPEFAARLDERISLARQNKLAVEDYQGATVTLTNPGTLGTSLSVPRLMAGQAAIVGVGAIGYPAEYAGMAQELIAELGLSKVMTLTSTYDHRVIQGAVSGAFLARVDELLQGADGLYERVFRELRVPQAPIRWSVDQNPRSFSPGGSVEAVAKQAGVLQLIRGYRVRGHLLADLDPLCFEPQQQPELELEHYGLGIWDLDRRFLSGGLAGSTGMLELRQIMDTLKQAYCRQLGVEYMHIQDPECRRWIQQRVEGGEALAPLGRETQLRILERLNAAEAFESFIGATYVGQKRFSLEGAETMIPMLDTLLADSAEAGIEEIVIGMAHRGRLNVLSNVVGNTPAQVFREFEGWIDPDTTHGSGDVKYHLGATGTYQAGGGREVRITVASNPSHLEAVNPVVEGMVRARQDRAGDLRRERTLPLLIHGDAAFAGQGVVAETLNLSQLKGYRTGGTLHLVVNNQIGFTTGPADARSSQYPTDVAKMVRAPIFHVNGDHPEAAVRAMRIALAYRQRFKSDVVVDLVCYRRWGHNEADDPSYTHPILYAKIQSHRSVRKQYTDQLLRRGDIDPETAERTLEGFRTRLREVHDEVRRAQSGAAERSLRHEIEASEGTARPRPHAGVDRTRLLRVLDGLERVPEGFRVHPKLAKQLAQRRERFEGGQIDWALAEALSFGSLVLEGTPVRLSGEDSGRGTFSQRHAVLYDHSTAEPYTPLCHLDSGQAPFQVFDSLLSEFAVLGFEYGYSVSHPDALVMWEAQFGDFVNGAQVILDQFLSSAEEKWGQRCGLVLLLPHGQEGQGPEHSSARIERFLQDAARGSMLVAVPSTPAQYFHLLRAQARDSRRKPLVMMTPKSLLRHRASVSTAADLTDGRFQLVIDDPHADPTRVRRLLLCCGKVYFDLEARRAEAKPEDTAICRVEQLYPFPKDELTELLRRHPATREVVWVQEEPRNMGAWSHIKERLGELLAPGQEIGYVGRPRNSSPAGGSLRDHVAQQEALVREAVDGQGRPSQPSIVTSAR